MTLRSPILRNTGPLPDILSLDKVDADSPTYRAASPDLKRTGSDCIFHTIWIVKERPGRYYLVYLMRNGGQSRWYKRRSGRKTQEVDPPRLKS